MTIGVSWGRALVSISIIGSVVTSAFAQGKPRGLIDFEARVKAGTAAMPKVVATRVLDSAIGGDVSWFVIKERPRVITYDVTKTNSLVAPLVGVVKVKEEYTSNHFKTEEEARALVPELQKSKLFKTISIRSIRFSYVNGKWELLWGSSDIYTEHEDKPTEVLNLYITREELLKGNGWGDLPLFARGFLGIPLNQEK